LGGGRKDEEGVFYLEECRVPKLDPCPHLWKQAERGKNVKNKPHEGAARGGGEKNGKRKSSRVTRLPITRAGEEKTERHPICWGERLETLSGKGTEMGE